MFIIKVDRLDMELVAYDRLTSGAVGSLRVRFDFDKSWDDVAKTAVFTAADTKISVLLDSEDSCPIPFEVLTRAGVPLTVGVYGVRGEDAVLPTVSVHLGRVEAGTVLGDNAADPTPSIYQQLVAIEQEALSSVEALRADAAAGRFDGKDGNVLFATFHIDTSTGILSMTVPDGADCPAFQITKGKLEVII